PAMSCASARVETSSTSPTEMPCRIFPVLANRSAGGAGSFVIAQLRGCRAFLVAPIVHEVTSCQEEPSIRPTVGSFLRTVPGRRTLPSESLVVRRSCERWHAPGAANDGEV